MLITARVLGCGLEHLCGPHSRRRQTGERQRVRNKQEEGWWDPRAAQKEALSFSITAVATTMVVVLPLSRARGQCETDVKCVSLCVGYEHGGNVKKI